MTSVSLQERLEEATEDLSRCQVASDVAEILRVEGVQGKRGDCETCPIAVLLLKRLGPGVSVAVDGAQLSAWIDEYSPTCNVRTPRAVAAFIIEFDGEAKYDRERDESIYPHGGWDEFAVTSP
jgi:hypothetical protein